MNALAVAALILMTVGSFGELAAVALEVKHREPVYALLMKVFPWIFGVGAVLMGVALAGR